jgi:hypothetical protein
MNRDIGQLSFTGNGFEVPCRRPASPASYRLSSLGSRVALVDRAVPVAGPVTAWVIVFLPSAGALIMSTANGIHYGKLLACYAVSGRGLSGRGAAGNAITRNEVAGYDGGDYRFLPD